MPLPQKYGYHYNSYYIVLASLLFVPFARQLAKGKIRIG